MSTSCTSRPPSIERTSSAAPYGGGPVSTRRFFFSVRIASASSSNDGATITSVKHCASASASAAGTGRLRATMPPNALTGSHALASTYASVMSSLDRDAARVGVLHDDARRFVEAVDEPPRRLGVEQVEVAHLLAAVLHGVVPPAPPTLEAVAGAGWCGFSP